MLPRNSDDTLPMILSVSHIHVYHAYAGRDNSRTCYYARPSFQARTKRKGKYSFLSCSADHEQDKQPSYPVDTYCATSEQHTYRHACMHTYIQDQCEWHKMTRMAGPDCAGMCNLINIHTTTYYIHTYIHLTN